MNREPEKEELEIDGETITLDEKAAAEEEEYFEKNGITTERFVSYEDYIESPEKYEGYKIIKYDKDLDFGEMKPFSSVTETRFGWRDKPEIENELNKGEKYYDPETESIIKFDFIEQPGNIKVNPKKQNITADMVLTSLLHKSTFDTPEVMADYMKEKRDGVMSYLFGQGDPTSAFECFVDKEQQKNGVYAFDEKKVGEMKNALSDENVLKKAKEVWSRGPFIDTFTEKFASALGVSGKALPDNPDAEDIYNEAKVGSIIPKDDVKELCKDVVNMKLQHEARPWWYRFRHPIDNFREWNGIRKAERILIDKFEADPEDLSIESRISVNDPEEEINREAALEAEKENIEVKEAEEKDIPEEIPENGPEAKESENVKEI